MSLPNNTLLSERLAVIGSIPPIALTAAGTAISNWISSNAPALGGTASTPGSFLYGRALLLVSTGAQTVATGTFTITVYKGNGTSGGTTSASIYTTSFTGTAGASICQQIDINLQNTFTVDSVNNDIAVYVQSANALPVSVVILGGDPRYGPASVSTQQQVGAQTPATPTGY